MTAGKYAPRTSWPTGPLVGHFMVIDALIVATERALVTFRGPEGAHEGIVFWGGREADGTILLTTAVVPRAYHQPQGVSCDEQAVRDVARSLRRHGLGLLAQVHSHPGPDARHSHGDDQMILLPFDGMLSIVVANYGRDGMRPLTTCGIHQFQGGRWMLCTGNLEALQVLPSVMDLRP